MNVLYFPDDILINIFYLCRHHNIIRLKSVCKQFYDIIETTNFWKNKIIFTKGFNFYHNVFLPIPTPESLIYFEPVYQIH